MTSAATIGGEQRQLRVGWLPPRHSWWARVNEDFYTIKYRFTVSTLI